jgi:hypothetical protein
VTETMIMIATTLIATTMAWGHVVVTQFPQ